jgi:MFS family permease
LVVLNLFVGIAGGGALPSVSALISICSPKKQIGAVFGLEKSIDSLARAIGATIGTSMAGWFGPRSALFFASFIYIFVFLIAQTRRVANIRAERSDTVPEPVKEVLP